MTKYLIFEQGVYRFIVEYIESIVLLDFQIHIIDNKKPNLPPYNNKDIYIFINKIPILLANTNVTNIFILNIEQLTKQNIKTYINDMISKNIQIIDYSLENLSLFNDYDKKYYLPYQYTDKEIDKLKNLMDITKKEYDVVFVGHLSPKRKKIYYDLEQKGLKMMNINSLWGDVRDKKIASAKVLLNVHFDDNYNIYEPFRCDRIVFSGMIVVSESSIDNKNLDINNLVIFGEYNKLVTKIVNIMTNYDIFYGEYKKLYENKINKIKIGREESLIYLKAKLENDIN